MCFRKKRTGGTRRIVKCTHKKPYWEIVFSAFSKEDSPKASFTQLILLFVFFFKVLYRETKQTQGLWLVVCRKAVIASIYTFIQALLEASWWLADGYQLNSESLGKRLYHCRCGVYFLPILWLLYALGKGVSASKTEQLASSCELDVLLFLLRGCFVPSLLDFRLLLFFLKAAGKPKTN